MVSICWAAKGGSGTTFIAASLALRAPRHSILVDLDGELPAALGLADPDGPGVADWLTSDADPDRLDDLLVAAGPTTRLLPFGRAAIAGRSRPLVVSPARWEQFGRWCDLHEESGARVVVDAGTGEPPPDLAALGHSLLVTRACYLSLRRAARAVRPPDGVVLVLEPGRAYRHSDVEVTIGAPVVATIEWDVSVQRAIDSGLLVARTSALTTRAFSRLAL